jgi:hypothetical protein
MKRQESVPHTVSRRAFLVEQVAAVAARLPGHLLINASDETAMVVDR